MAYLHPHILSHLPSYVSDTPVLSESSVFLDDTRPLRDGGSAILEWAWSASLSTLKPFVKKLHYLWKGWMVPSSVKFPQMSAPICQHPVGPTLLCWDHRLLRLRSTLMCYTYVFAGRFCDQLCIPCSVFLYWEHSSFLLGRKKDD